MSRSATRGPVRQLWMLPIPTLKMSKQIRRKWYGINEHERISSFTLKTQIKIKKHVPTVLYFLSVFNFPLLSEYNNTYCLLSSCTVVVYGEKQLFLYLSNTFLFINVYPWFCFRFYFFLFFFSILTSVYSNLIFFFWCWSFGVDHYSQDKMVKHILTIYTSD